MYKKIIGVLLVVAGLFTAFLGVKAGAGAPANQEIIESAVLVADGKVLPENEGKVVLVHGTLSAVLPFVDEETGVELNSIAAYRRVEKVSIDKATEEDKKDTWSWLLVSNPNAYGGSKKLIAPDVTLGEFAVSEALAQAIGTNEKREDYSSAELSALGWKKFEDDGLVYLYQGDDMPCEDEKVAYTGGLLGKKNYDYLDYVDTYRVRYDVIKEGSTMEYTVIGLQKNGRLEAIEELDLTAMMSGHLTMEEMLEYAGSSAKAAVITAIVIAVVLIGVGVLLFLRGTKQR